MTRTALLAKTREDAHQAVKAFDRKPDHANTKAAMDALSLYLGLLSQGYDQTPKTREEQAAFARSWDAKVEAGRFTGPGYEAHPGHDHEDCCK